MFKLIKFIVPILITLYLLKNILSDLPKIAELPFLINPFAVFICLVLAGAIYIEGGYCWNILLRKLGVKTSFLQSLRIWIISNTGRYIPGMIWQYIGRLELAKKNLTTDRKVILLSIILETYFAIVAALILSATSLLTSINVLLPFNPYFFIPILIVIAIFPKTIYIVSRVLGKFSKLNIENLKINLSIQDIIFILAFFILNFIIGGLLLFLIAYIMNNGYPPESLLFMISLYSISWIGGYLSFFSPGGIGVAEGITAYVLSFYVPVSTASLIAITFRFTITLVELVLFVIFIKIKKNGA